MESTTILHWICVNATDTPAWASSIRIVPNPTQGLVQIISDEPCSGISLYHADGSLIWRGVTPSLDLSGFEPGLYWIRMEWKDGKTATQKVVKF